ncbi:MAG: GNAT family N-acetyltransferase [Actinophytocola sp.]|nr:GNAT family N-acetyltransferase [Actinophytocola sp.]
MDRHYGKTEFEAVDVRERRIADILFGSPPLSSALVARRDGVLAGIATYSFHWPAADLHTSMFMKDLFVADGHRGAGIGEGLLRALRKVAAERECSRIEWTVDQGNTGAERFYAALGAQRTDKTFYRWPG